MISYSFPIERISRRPPTSECRNMFLFQNLIFVGTWLEWHQHFGQMRQRNSVHQLIKEKEMPGYWGRGKLVANSWKLVFRSSNHQPQKQKKEIEVIQHGAMIAEAAGIFFGSEEVKGNTISVQQQRNQNQQNLDQFEKEPDMESSLSLRSLLNDINCDYNRHKQGLHVDDIISTSTTKEPTKKESPEKVPRIKGDSTTVLRFHKNIERDQKKFTKLADNIKRAKSRYACLRVLFQAFDQ